MLCVHRTLALCAVALLAVAIASVIADIDAPLVEEYCDSDSCGHVSGASSTSSQTESVLNAESRHPQPPPADSDERLGPDSLNIITEHYAFDPLEPDVNVEALRNEVRDAFSHAYNGYLRHAYPADELCPLTCTGRNTWASNALTLVDTLDTLYVLGNYTEFARVTDVIAATLEFQKDVNVSVFEINIRVLGGLLAGHQIAIKLSASQAVKNTDGTIWTYADGLLSKALDLGERLLPAFDTPTGIPYGTLNLIHGVHPNETTVTSLATAGTLTLEFGMLTRYTGRTEFERLARTAVRAIWSRRSRHALLGNHIDVMTGKWIFVDAGIGPNQDSFYEYLLKAHLLFGDEEYLLMFEDLYKAVISRNKVDDWYIDVEMATAQPSIPWFTALSAFWPGLQVLYGHVNAASRTLAQFFSVWRRFGFVPEAFDLGNHEIARGQAGYFLRPEMAESVLYVYQATKDPFWLHVGRDILTSIVLKCKTPCGFAVVNNVTTHELSDTMESFFLSETLKYLYLLFDEANPIHAGNYVFTTEAHVFEIKPEYLWRQWSPAETHKSKQFGKVRGKCPRRKRLERFKSIALGLPTAEPVRAQYAVSSILVRDVDNRLPINATVINSANVVRYLTILAQSCVTLGSPKNKLAFELCYSKQVTRKHDDGTKTSLGYLETATRLQYAQFTHSQHIVAGTLFPETQPSGAYTLHYSHGDSCPYKQGARFTSTVTYKCDEGIVWPLSDGAVNVIDDCTYSFTVSSSLACALHVFQEAAK